jgi:hypothetical protein
LRLSRIVENLLSKKVNEKAKECISYINELTEHTFERQIKKVLSVPFKLDAFDELKKVKINELFSQTRSDLLNELTSHLDKLNDDDDEDSKDCDSCSIKKECESFNDMVKGGSNYGTQ